MLKYHISDIGLAIFVACLTNAIAKLLGIDFWGVFWLNVFVLTRCAVAVNERFFVHIVLSLATIPSTVYAVFPLIMYRIGSPKNIWNEMAWGLAFLPIFIVLIASLFLPSLNKYGFKVKFAADIFFFWTAIIVCLICLESQLNDF